MTVHSHVSGDWFRIIFFSDRAPLEEVTMEIDVGADFRESCEWAENATIPKLPIRNQSLTTATNQQNMSRHSVIYLYLIN